VLSAVAACLRVQPPVFDASACFTPTTTPPWTVDRDSYLFAQAIRQATALKSKKSHKKQKSSSGGGPPETRKRQAVHYMESSSSDSDEEFRGF